MPMILPLFRYLEFSGRSSRTEYWLFTLFCIGLSVGARVLDGKQGSAADPAGFFSLTVAFFIFLPHLACSVRRLHDQGRSGWWLLLHFIPFGFFVCTYFMFCGGSSGTNDYGDDPRHSASQDYSRA